MALVKPDGVKRGLVGEITKRVERRGLKIIALKHNIDPEKLITEANKLMKRWIFLD